MKKWLHWWLFPISLGNIKYIHKGLNLGQEYTQQMGITRVINLYGTILFFHFPNLIFKIDDWIPFVHI